MDAQRRITKRIMQLGLNQATRFASSFLCSKVRDFNHKGTLAVSSTHLMIDPEFVSKLNDYDLDTILIHESLHIALLHMCRFVGKNHKISNIAADAVVNYIIKNKFSRRFPEEFPGVHFDWVDDKMTMEAVYQRLEQEAPEFLPNCPQDLIPSEMTDSALKEVMTIASVMKKSGNLPGAISEMLSEFLEVKIPWQVILEQFFSQASSDGLNWNKRNLHYSSIYMPGYGQPRLGKIAIAVDTSASMDKETLFVCMAEIRNLLEQCEVEEVQVIECDTKISNIKYYTNSSDFELTCKGRGGTDFRPVFEHLSTQDVSCLIYFTDLDGPFPEFPPAFSVLWICNHEHDHYLPFGERLNLLN